MKILSKDKTISQMANELDVHYSTVREWVISYKQDGSNSFPGSGNLKPEDEAIRKLRRQLSDCLY